MPKRTASSQAFGKQKLYIRIDQIETPELYRQLENIVYARADEQERDREYRDGTQCPFSTDDVRQALTSLGIAEEEILRAIKYCVEVDFLHLRQDRNYHLDRGHLAHYNAWKRRQ